MNEWDCVNGLVVFFTVSDFVSDPFKLYIVKSQVTCGSFWAILTEFGAIYLQVDSRYIQIVNPPNQTN